MLVISRPNSPGCSTNLATWNSVFLWRPWVALLCSILAPPAWGGDVPVCLPAGTSPPCSANFFSCSPVYQAADRPLARERGTFEPALGSPDIASRCPPVVGMEGLELDSAPAFLSTVAVFRLPLFLNQRQPGGASKW